MPRSGHQRLLPILLFLQGLRLPLNKVCAFLQPTLVSEISASALSQVFPLEGTYPFQLG